MKKQIATSLQIPLSATISNSLRKVFEIFNFEFMDIDNLPNSLRSTLRDILEVGNGKPFRNYYQWATQNIYEYAQENNIQEIVELGAGCAPITKHLIKKYPHWDATFKITDINPDQLNFSDLSNTDTRVKPIFQPLDFTKKIKGFENSLLVLSATFHHVEEKQKIQILNNLKSLSPHVMIFEPLRPTIFSIFFVCAALTSGLLTPFFQINSKRFFRCLFWCWVVPLAPMLFIWDGWISAFRCWQKSKWHIYEPQAQVHETLFCTKVLLTK